MTVPLNTRTVGAGGAAGVAGDEPQLEIAAHSATDARRCPILTAILRPHIAAAIRAEAIVLFPFIYIPRCQTTGSHDQFQLNWQSTVIMNTVARI